MSDRDFVAEQEEFWNGEGGERFVRHQALLDAQLADYGRAAQNAAGIKHGDSVLDIGCGCGETSVEIARTVGATGRVVGVDISEIMLERAEQLAGQDNLTNAFFEHRNVETEAIHGDSFDAAFSRFGVMFFSDPVRAFKHVYDALHPGGRLGFACWQKLQDNPWIALQMQAVAEFFEMPPPPAPDEPGPFSFADTERVKGILEGAGFRNVKCQSMEKNMVFGDGEGLPDTVRVTLELGPASRFMIDADAATKEKVYARVEEIMSPYFGADGLKLLSRAWIVTADKAQD